LSSTEPRISSLEPLEYTFAVSKKLTPGVQRLEQEGGALILGERPRVPAPLRVAIAHAPQAEL
jgi:hypothetical protein